MSENIQQPTKYCMISAMHKQLFNPHALTPLIHPTIYHFKLKVSKNALILTSCVKQKKKSS